MNALVRTVVLPLTLLGLAGCAGMQQKSVAAYVAPQRAPSLMDVDQAYVARVEAIARRRGIGVVWVNSPSRPVAKTD